MEHVQVISHGGRDFAVGLLWQPLSASNAGERQTEIKGLGKELDVNLHVLPREAQCVGFVKSGGEVKAGVVSMAAAVSSRLAEEFNARDFIFVTEIDAGRWYYLAQKDGVILSDGDQILSSEDAAKSQMYEDSSLGDWTNVIVPSHWGIADSIESPGLAQLLPRKKKGPVPVLKDWQLAPVSITPLQILAQHSKPLLVIGIAMIGGYFGLQYIKSYQREQAIAEASRVAQQMQAQQKAELPRPRPWGEMPAPLTAMQACLDTVAQVPLFPGNWDLSGITCSGGVVIVAWKPRGLGWIDHLRQVVPQAVISVDGSLASVTQPLPSLPNASDEDVASANERISEMYAQAQRFGVKFTAKPPSIGAPASLPGQGGEKSEPKLWDEMGWKVDGATLPDVALHALNGNGFRLRAMSAQWNAGQLVWTMEGSQYVRK